MHEWNVIVTCTYLKLGFRRSYPYRQSAQELPESPKKYTKHSISSKHDGEIFLIDDEQHSIVLTLQIKYTDSVIRIFIYNASVLGKLQVSFKGRMHKFDFTFKQLLAVDHFTAFSYKFVLLMRRDDFLPITMVRICNHGFCFFYRIQMRGLWIQIILVTVSWSFAFLSLRMHDAVIKYLYAMMNILQVKNKCLTNIWKFEYFI